ncbi:MAG: mycofactocin biosynthesis peptidyl-dipeptidase MftE [Acidimicrobiales bacterium]
MKLASATWPTVAARASDSILAVPVGSTEQHGPHLPLSTDTDIALAMTSRLAAVRPDVVVAPPLAFGSSGEHAGFAGTLSIGEAALEEVVVELVRSADAFRAVVLVGAHGGNAGPVSRAVARLKAEGRRVLAWAPAYEGDLHAGRTETSLMLALDPSAVCLEQAEAGDRRSLRELLPTLRAQGVAAVSPNGVLGDPTGANAAEGLALLDTLTSSLAAAVDVEFGS